MNFTLIYEVITVIIVIGILLFFYLVLNNFNFRSLITLIIVIAISAAIVGYIYLGYRLNAFGLFSQTG